LIYPLLLLGLLGTLGWRLAARQPAELTFLRMHSAPYTLLADGRVSCQVHLRVQNKGPEPLELDLDLTGPGELIKPTFPVRLEPKAMAESSVFVVLPRAAFVRGITEIELALGEVAGIEAAGLAASSAEPLVRARRTLLGPQGPAPAPAAAPESSN
jgi:hypothetical protein